MKISDSSVLVTGGAGFIGTHLVESLLTENADVTVVDDLSNGDASALPDEVTLIEGSLADDAVLQEALTVEIDFVVHLAAHKSVKTDSPRRDCLTNLEMTYAVLERMKAVGVSKILFASSSTVYGEAPTPTPESHSPLEPISAYGASKLACEAVLSTYAHSQNFTVWNLRFANVVGPRLRGAVIPDFIEKLRADEETLEILGDGRQEKSYLHIEDCIAAMLYVVDNTEESMNTYNLGTDGATSVTQIADIVSRGLGVDPEYEYTGGDRGWTGDVPRMRLSIARLHDMGFSPRYGSDEAVERAVTELAEEL